VEPKEVSEQIAKALKERLAPITKEVETIAKGVKTLKSKIKAFDLQFKTAHERLDNVQNFLEEHRQIKDKDEYQPIVDAINGLGNTIIDLIKAQLVARAEPDIDITKINWMVKGKLAASQEDPWAWTFAYDRQGNILPETREVVEAIQQYGEIKVGDYTITLGGDRNNLLNRKKG